MNILSILMIFIFHQMIGGNLMKKDSSSRRFRRNLLSISGYRAMSNSSISSSSSVICPSQSSSFPLTSIVISNLGSINAATLNLPNQPDSIISMANERGSVLAFDNPPTSPCYMFKFYSPTSPINPNDINNIQTQFFYDSSNLGTNESRSVGSSNGYGGNSSPNVPNKDAYCGYGICKNGGICQYEGRDGYLCKCPSNDLWLDNDCSKPNPCMRSPCNNGGQCYYLPNATYYCVCFSGYTGANCQSSLAITPTATASSYNPCWSTRPCLNGGTCLPQGNQGRFTCQCPPGYTGTNCQASNNFPGSPGLPPNSCGISSLSYGRIVGGTPVKTNSWPWIISLQTKYGGSHFCGGTLVDASHVVTAAHCFDQTGTSADQFKVVAGLLNMRQRSVPTIQERTIERIFRHEQYSPTALVNDIAVIKLRTPVQITAAVFPICLPSGNSADDPKVGQNVLIAGWGYTSNVIQQVADQLEEGTIQILDLNGGSYGRPGCSAWIRQGYRLTNNQQICAMSLDTRTDSCKGDSGGPLIGLIKSQWYLFGVVSFGDTKCAASTSAGVYTRVSAYIPWIQQKLRL